MPEDFASTEDLVDGGRGRGADVYALSCTLYTPLITGRRELGRRGNGIFT